MNVGVCSCITHTHLSEPPRVCPTPLRGSGLLPGRPGGGEEVASGWWTWPGPGQRGSLCPGEAPPSPAAPRLGLGKSNTLQAGGAQPSTGLLRKSPEGKGSKAVMAPMAPERGCMLGCSRAPHLPQRKPSAAGAEFPALQHPQERSQEAPSVHLQRILPRTKTGNCKGKSDNKKREQNLPERQPQPHLQQLRWGSGEGWGVENRQNGLQAGVGTAGAGNAC